MSSQIIPVEPFDYVVFGGTGDLAERKLLPALYHRQLDGQLTDPTRIIGASRSCAEPRGIPQVCDRRPEGTPEEGRI